MTMKKIIYLLVFAATVLSMVSCKDFLELYPEDSLSKATFYKNDDQVKNALTSIYAPLRKSALGSTYMNQANGSTDEVFMYNVPTESLQNYSYSSTNSNIKSIWQACYLGIKNANALLEGLENPESNVSADVYRHAKGEALFFRGYYHFMVIQWWGSKTTGIPLYTSTPKTYADTKKVPSSIKQVYDQIIEDMEQADKLLTDQTVALLGYSERVTKDAVDGILVRVCLYAAGYPLNGGAPYYEKAIKWGLEVTKLNHSLVNDYKDVFIDQMRDRYNKETIWEVGYQYYGTDPAIAESNAGGNVGSSFGMTRVFRDRNTSAEVLDSALVNEARFVHPRLLNAYGQGDSRRNWAIGNYSYENQTLRKTPFIATTDIEEEKDAVLEGYFWEREVGKWRREYEPKMIRDKSSNSTNFPLLRYSDVLLMIAEAYNELDNQTDALPFINEVRLRAIPFPDTFGVVDSVEISSANNIGYLATPEVTVTGGGGTGLQLMVGYNSRNLTGTTLGRLLIGVTDPGRGYTSAPIVTVAPPQPTWTPGMVLLKGFSIMAPNRCLYEVEVDGIATDVPPTHTTALSSSTTPTIAQQTSINGAQMKFVGGPIANIAPTIKLTIRKSVKRNAEDVLTAVNQTTLRQFIRDERYRELCFECLRTQDLKRWGTLVETVRNMGEDVLGNTKGIPPSTVQYQRYQSVMSTAQNISDKHNFWPIPETELALNPNLVQNIGY